MTFSADNPFAQPKTTPSHAKRLAVALVVAALAHLAVIVQFNASPKPQPQPSTQLDVTLVSFSAGQNTTDPDAPALDSPGTQTATPALEAAQPTAPSTAPEPSPAAPSQPKAEPAEPSKPAAAVVAPHTQTTPAAPKPMPQAAQATPPQPQPKPQAVVQPKTAQPVAKAQPTPRPSTQRATQPTPPAKPAAPQAPATTTGTQPLSFSRDQLSASLAKIQSRQSLNAPNSRISRHQRSTDQRDISYWYRDAWRKKVERIGNLNYPDAARRQGLYGRLRVRVLINRDGSLQQAQIVQSSGHAILDQGALNIIRMSAPYAPFSNELAAKYDQIEIIRNWYFNRGDRLSSQ